MKDKVLRRKILGVDPGTNILGYAMIEIVGQEIRVLDFNVINLKSFKDHQTKLREIYLQLQEVIETYLPDEMAIEAPFFGKNVQSMLKLGRAQGVSIAAEEQVAAMLKQILHISFENMSHDATDALAVAVCHHLQASSRISTSGGSSWKKFISENQDRVR